MRALLALLLLGLLGAANVHAQVPPLSLEQADEPFIRRDAQLAFERALLEMKVDSVHYWLDRTIAVKRRKQQSITYVFDYKLRTLAGFHVGRFPEVQADILRGRDFFENYEPPIEANEPMTFSRPEPVRLRNSMGIYDLWILHAQRVMKDIQEQVPDTNEREFLCLYWIAMLNDVYVYELRPPFPEDSLFQQRAATLLRRVPQHPRADLLRHWGRIYRPSRAGAGWTMQGGTHLLYGELEPLFRVRHDYNFGLEFTRKRMVYMSTLHLYASELTTDMVYKDSLWSAGTKTSTVMLGMQVGYMVYDSPLFRVIPTAGAHLANLAYFTDDVGDETDHYFQPTVEVNMDLKLNFKAQAEARRASPEQLALYSTKRHGYYLVRGTIGFAPLGYGPVIEPQGSMLYFSIGIGGFRLFATNK